MARLPDLGRLPLAPTAEYGDERLDRLALGRRTRRNGEREGRARIDRRHHDHVHRMLEARGADLAHARPDELRHHWQYFFGRYRDENQVPAAPAAYAELVGKPEYEGAGRLDVVEGTPIARRAYHAEITLDSPDVFEMQTHDWHWWLLQHAAHHYHGIDHKVKQLLFDLGRDAVRFKYGERANAVVRPDLVEADRVVGHRATDVVVVVDGVARHGAEEHYAYEPSYDDWHMYLDERVHSESLHVGYASQGGVSMYWRVEDELYDYLAYPLAGNTTRSGTLGGREAMRAPWVLDVQADAEYGIITPRALFEHLLLMAVLKSAGADMTCVQKRDVTNPYQQKWGTEIVQYRCKYNLPDDLKQYGPSCDDTWPEWERMVSPV